MARYVFRLAILGPAPVSAAQVATAVTPALGAFGFGVDPPTITEVKGLAPPVRHPAPDDPSVITYYVNVPPYGEFELDDTPAGAAIRFLTTAEIAFYGTLPNPRPTAHAGEMQSGASQVSSAVFRAAFASLGPAYYNYSGGPRTGLETPSSGGAVGIMVGLLVVGGAYALSKSPSRMYGLDLGRVPRLVEADRIRKRAQQARHDRRYVLARKLEAKANRIARSA